MENTENLAGHISQMGLLNLLSAKTEADIEGIKSIREVGLILVPENLLMALNRIPMTEVGAVAPVPAGDKISLIAGQASLTGEALESGDPDTVLFIAGQVTITTPVPKIGYKSLYLAGQLLAPRGSEAAIANAMKMLAGQILYMPVGARTFTGEEVFDQAFLEYLEKPTPFALMGSFRFANDVKPETLREKVPEIFLCGELKAPASLVSLVKVLTVEKHGSISVTNESE